MKRSCKSGLYALTFMPMSLPYCYRGDLFKSEDAFRYEVRILRLRWNNKQHYFWLETKKLKKIVTQCITNLKLAQK